MPASFDQNNIAALTARAIDRLGTAEFYDRLLDILGAAAPHELAALVRYSRAAPPDLIIPRIKPTEAMRDYYHHFYAFDPFYTHWKGGGEIGVFQLRAMDPGIGRSRYAREFLMAMAIHDEIAVFLPPIGEASPTLILDRASRPFTAAEVGKVRRLFPLLAALHRRHISIFVTSGVDPVASPIGQERPLRLREPRRLGPGRHQSGYSRDGGPASSRYSRSNSATRFACWLSPGSAAPKSVGIRSRNVFFQIASSCGLT